MAADGKDGSLLPEAGSVWRTFYWPTQIHPSPFSTYSTDSITGFPCPPASVGFGQGEALTGIRGWLGTGAGGVFIPQPVLLPAGCLSLLKSSAPVGVSLLLFSPRFLLQAWGQ